jgi:hypothetical protein
MDPQATTPPDRPERGPAQGGPSWRFEDDPLARDWDDGDSEGPGAEEDWRARYGAPPPPPPPRSGPDFSALFILLDGLRRAAPAELQGRLTSLIREGLMTLRSLIDWYLERLDRRPPEREVEDIPID